MKQPPESAPPRLSTQDPALAALFDRVEQDYRRELDEETAFRRLSRRLRTKSGWLGPQHSRWRLAGALLGAVCLFALGQRLIDPHAASAPPLRMTREELRDEPPPAEPARPAPGDPPAPAPLAPLAPRPAARLRPATPRAKLEPRKAPVLEPLPGATAAAPAAAATPPAAAPAADCLALARAGNARAAERCFADQAAGTGLAAELALYELARLRRDVLGDPGGALAALDDHRARFGRGSLRQEVDMFRVELLARLGHAREALASSAALLASPGGRERAAELHLLRGNVYRQDLADPLSAAREYEQAQAFGGAAARQARRWLEQLESPGPAREVRP
jgi:hypothetical protein